MLSGEKILITGPAGRIAYGIAKSLAPDNEVWGIARFSDRGGARRGRGPRGHDPRDRLGRRRLRATSPRTSPTCCTSPPTSARTTNAAYGSTPRAPDCCLSHCRKAKAALVMSTRHGLQTAPRPVASLPGGRSDRRCRCCPARSRTPSSRSARRPWPGTAPASSICRSPSPGWAAPTASAAVSRCGTCRPSPRAARRGQMGSAALQPYPLRRHQRAASKRCSMRPPSRRRSSTGPATCRSPCSSGRPIFGDLLGVEADLHVEVVPGASVGSVGDHTKRVSITGPCTVDWRDGFPCHGRPLLPRSGEGAMKTMRYPSAEQLLDDAVAEAGHVGFRTRRFP